jgi:thioredoxin reductase
MTDSEQTPPLPGSVPDAMFPALTPAQQARVAAHGGVPYLLETSLPGVFAVGDVRKGNIKRVASAVGEGSIAVAFVHQVRNE